MSGVTTSVTAPAISFFSMNGSSAVRTAGIVCARAAEAHVTTSNAAMRVVRFMGGKCNRRPVAVQRRRRGRRAGRVPARAGAEPPLQLQERSLVEVEADDRGGAAQHRVGGNHPTAARPSRARQVVQPQTLGHQDRQVHQRQVQDVRAVTVAAKHSQRGGPVDARRDPAPRPGVDRPEQQRGEEPRQRGVKHARSQGWRVGSNPPLRTTTSTSDTTPAQPHGRRVPGESARTAQRAARAARRRRASRHARASRSRASSSPPPPR